MKLTCKTSCFRTAFLGLLGVLGLFAQTVPTQYQATYSNMTTQIGSFQTTVSQNWNGTPYPVAWAPHLLSAESDNYLQLLEANHYNDAVSTELLEIRATGAKAVTVHISFPILYQPFYTYSGTPSNYQAFVSFYQQVAAGVHAAGMKLVVEATVAEQVDGTEGGTAFAPYYQTLDWNDYMAGRAQNAVNIAQLILPDYLSLICEPDSEANNASQPTENSPTGALQLLQTQLTALQQANITNVSLGAGAGNWIPSFTTYLQNFAATSLDYIDMHVYAVNDGDLTNVLTGASIIQQAGKGIGVSEAWPDKESDSELGTLNINIIDSRDVFSFWAPVDTAFLQAMVDCAQYYKFLFFAPSYPAYFAAYLSFDSYGADSPAELLPDAFNASFAANLTGTFTSTGVAFSKMIAGNDTTPPMTPSAPTLSSSSSTGATITWIPTTDNIGVAGYNIYRDGEVVAQIATPPFYDTGLTPGDTYIYGLSAFDAQGNVSPQSETLTVTLIDLSPPTVPAGLAVSGVTQNSVSLKWSASTGGGGVGGYRLLKGTSPSTIKVVQPSVLGTSYVDSEVAPQTTYYYAVESYNETGVSSAPSATISATTLALPPPTGLQATTVTISSVSLSWTASGGSDAPASYRILKGTSPSSLTTVANSAGTTYTDSHVATSTTYYYEVEMADSSGRTSGPSSMLTVATPGAPSVPVNLAVTGNLPHAVSLNWTPSTGTSGVGGYYVLRGTSPASMSVHASLTAPPYTDSAAVLSTTYYYQVESYSPLGVVSTPGNQVTVATPAPPSVPANLVVTGKIPGSVSLNWTPSTGTGGVGGYYVLRGTSPASMSVHANVPAPPYTDQSAELATTYYYQVESYSPLNLASGPGNEVTVTTSPLPSAPANLVVTSVTPGAPGSITLNWTPTPGLAASGGYRILRGTSPTNLSVHGQVAAAPYTDPYAVPSTTYYYEVESYELGIASAASNVVTVTTAAK